MSGPRKLRKNVVKALEELKNNPKLKPIENPPLRPVKAIQFGVLSPEEIKDVSVCNITNSRINQSPNNTVYDERMGPPHSRGICTTCGEDIRACPGHFGHLELAVPIIHPMFTKFIVTILNCICIKCSKLRLSREEIDLEMNILEHDRYIRYVDRLKIIVQKCANVAFCADCSHPYPSIKEIDGHIYKMHDSGKKGIKSKQSRIEVNELKNILMKISNQDMEIMGFTPIPRKVYKYGTVEETLYTFRPEWLILTNLPVIPPMSRPPDHDGDNRSDDDLTTSYTDIVKYNEKLKDKNITEMTRTNLVTLIQKHVKALFDNSDGTVTRSSGKVAKGIKERVSGKNGHIRGKLMGKRVDCSARTVITADPTLRLNEIGIPEEIADDQSFPEKVIPRNIKNLKESLENGRVNTIRRGNSIIKVKYALQKGAKIKLRYGDYVYRKFVDGDIAILNRQPTLHRGSMMAHHVKKLPGKTFRLNLSVTTPYNADFDGDEMQAHFPQDHGAAQEADELMGVNKHIVSSQANKPIMGAIQDVLTGVSLMTKDDVAIKRHQFFDCVMSAGEEYIHLLPSLFARAEKYYPDNLFNGRVLFSILLPEDYSIPEHKNSPIAIREGVLLSGIVDKKSVGRGHGSIIHRLYKERDPDTAADFLSSIQFLVNRWLTYRGFSVGIQDFIISEDNKRGVEVAIQKAYIEVESIQNSDDPDNIKEFKINNALNNRGQNLVIDGLKPDNRMMTMISCGSKGSQMNLIQITGHLGQNNVEGKRIQHDIDNGQRTLACFKRGNTHPITRGFIERSFIDGLKPYEFWFHSKAGREGVINTAVKTRDSGYAERKLVKRMEDLTVQLDHTVRNSVNNIVSFSYGDLLNPTLVYRNDGPSFVDIDNLVDQLNAEPSPNLDDGDKVDIMRKACRGNRVAELDQSIREYQQSIKKLKSKKDATCKILLKSAQKKLVELRKERKSL